RFRDALPVIDVRDLPHPDGANALSGEQVEHRSLRRRLREVAAVVRALEAATPIAHEGPGDDTREPVTLAGAARRLAPGIERLQRHLLLVRSDLVHAVRARVHVGT